MGQSISRYTRLNAHCFSRTRYLPIQLVVCLVLLVVTLVAMASMLRSRLFLTAAFMLQSNTFDCR